MSRPGPHVHGVEDYRGSRFWANGDDTESDSEEDESVESIDTPELVKEAQVLGFSVPQLIEVDKELNDVASEESPREGTMAKKIIDAFVSHRAKSSSCKPW